MADSKGDVTKFQVHRPDLYRPSTDPPPFKWPVWTSVMECYFQAAGITDERQKLIQTANNLGPLAMVEYIKGNRNGNAIQDNKISYAKFLEDCAFLFHHKPSPVRAHFDFNKATQHPSESVQEYIFRLRTLAEDCDFGDRADYFIAVQLAGGCYSDKVKEELLTESKIDLCKFLKRLQAAESAAIDKQVISRDLPDFPLVGAVNTSDNRSKKNRQNGDRKTCFGCGNPGHFLYDDDCPAKEINCRRCGRKGHFGNRCKTKNVSSIQRIGSITKDFTVNACLATNDSCATLRMEVDTKSDITGIPKSLFYKNFNKKEIFPYKQTILNFDNSEIKGIVGCFNATIMIGEKHTLAQVVILPNNVKPTIGADVIHALELLQLKISGVYSSQSDYDEMLKSFPTLLSPEIGLVPDYCHTIEMIPGSKPVSVKCRKIPLYRQDGAKEAVFEMERQGIWEKVDKAQWVSGLVTVDKPDGSVRITSDFTHLNPNIIPSVYPLPICSDIHTKLSHSSVFSTLDLTKYYFNIEISPESRHLTSTITPWGLFQYRRLPMGLRDSAAVSQRFISQLLQDIPGVEVYIDDIIVHGSTVSDHDGSLKKVFQKLTEANLRINIKKCKFGSDSVKFLGHEISKGKIRPLEKNIQPIMDFKIPQTKKQIQSFLGMLNYYAAYIQDFAVTAEPLRALIRKGARFEWTDKCQKAFEELKHVLTSGLELALYQHDAVTYVTTDASEYAIGGELSQVQNGIEKPVAFGHRRLSPTQQKYSASEREALAALHFIEYWEHYLLGKKFVLRTDHQALKALLLKPGNKHQSAKFQRWFDRLSQFNFTVEYKKGNENQVADVLSRMPSKDKEPPPWDVPEKVVKIAATQMEGLNQKRFEMATKSDEKLQELKNLLPILDARKLPSNLKEFNGVREELSVEGDLILRGDRIVVPQSLRQEILKRSHSGHPGICRLKSKLREAYYWPRMDSDIEFVVKSCQSCEMSNKSMPRHAIPEIIVPRPERSWQKLAIDITGPFETAPQDSKFIVVLIDYFSSYPLIYTTSNITSGKIIGWLDEVFSMFGNPSQIVSDNGPQFVSYEFINFLANRGISHCRTAVYTPQQNGLVERFNRTLKNAIQTFSGDSGTWKEKLNAFLSSYRSTKPDSQKSSPSDLILKHKHRLPYEFIIKNNEAHLKCTEIYPRGGKYPVRAPFRKGNKVRVKIQNPRKGQPAFSEPKEILECIGLWNYRLNDGQVHNARRLKKHFSTSRRVEDIGNFDASNQRSTLLPKLRERTELRPPDRYVPQW